MGVSLECLELARRLEMLKQDERWIEDESTRRLVRELLLLLLLLSHFSHVRLCETPWMAAHQAPPSMGFSRQEYWSGLPLPSPSQRASRGQTDILCTIRRAYKTLLSLHGAVILPLGFIILFSSHMVTWRSCAYFWQWHNIPFHAYGIIT